MGYKGLVAGYIWGEKGRIYLRREGSDISEDRGVGYIRGGGGSDISGEGMFGYI